MPDIYQLKNGMKAIRYYVPDSPVVHCALMINCGARDEPANKTGLAHFIEHTFFKGTKNRTSRQILNSLEISGGELNAYTTKEETCLHASVIKEHLWQASDVISDIFLNATFPVRELEKEKKVILDEIHAYEDMPYEQIYDDFENVLFKNHPLGNSILGKEKHIQTFTQKDILHFMKTRYSMQNIVWIVAGDVDEKSVLKTAALFNKGKASGKLKRASPVKRNKIIQLEKKPISQYHYISGKKGYAFDHPNRFALSLLNNVLGGPGMNSRLNMNIREKYGFTYTIESGYHAFSDTGIFHLYFATDKKYFEKTKQLVAKELTKLAEEKITERKLNQYKQQLCGQIIMAQENKLNVMLGMGRSALLKGRIPALEELIERIQTITVSKFKSVADEMLDPASMTTLIFEPEE
ncbi:MAG: pitrilysin family protein [Bacteroidota bacterium]